jgi:hypothetical protein
MGRRHITERGIKGKKCLTSHQNNANQETGIR